MTLLIDHSEPEEIIKLASQSVPVAVMNLNQTNRSDYYFGGEDGRTRQFSRKQAGELLGSLDEAEAQLRDYYENADENYQIVEGVISPVAITKKNKSLEAISIRRGASASNLFTYKVTETGFIHDEQTWSVSSTMLYSWLRSLDRAGVTTHYTINWVDTARLLVAFYKNDQKLPENHTTLNRYIRPRIQIKTQDPFVKALMYLSSAYQIGIGEEKAKSIATRYKTLFDVNMAEISELCQCAGIGKVVAKKLLIALGREI